MRKPIVRHLRRTSHRVITASVLSGMLAALITRGWWRTFEWGSPERLRYSWALRARLADRYAWGRPADSQPSVSVQELDDDLARAAQDVNAAERWIIGHRVRRAAS